MDIFVDEKENEIKEFDVLKVFHFIGARRKRNYMYKWVRKNDKQELCFQHLGIDKRLVNMKCCCTKNDNKWVFHDAEIVQSRFAA